jgi:hypothetical protein
MPCFFTSPKAAVLLSGGRGAGDVAIVTGEQ